MESQATRCLQKSSCVFGWWRGYAFLIHASQGSARHESDEARVLFQSFLQFSQNFFHFSIASGRRLGTQLLHTLVNC